MEVLLFLLLPVAAFTGWLTGRKSLTSKKTNRYFSGLEHSISCEPDKTVDALVQMSSIDDDTVETHLTLGSIFRRRGELGRAIRLHQGLLERPTLADPYKSLAHLELARDYIAAGVLDRAEAILLELVEHKEQLVPSLQHLLDLYQQGKEWHAAIAIAQQLEKHKQQSYATSIAHFYCELAELALRNQDALEAKSYLQTAQKIQPSCERTQILLENLHTQKQNLSGVTLQHKISAQDRYRCNNCGFTTTKLEWNCPSCKQWDVIKPISKGAQA